MKTNQRLSVPFELGSLDIEHKTLMGDVRKWFALGNEYRRKNGLPPVDIQNYFNSRDNKEFIEEVSKKIGRDAVVTSRGRGARMKAHLYVLLDIASFLSATFKVEVYRTFVESRICDLRDESGDMYLEMNAALQLAAESVLGKPAHKGHFITLANIIKKRCGVEDWNLTTPEAHAKRTRIEDKLASMLQLGVVRDWEHLKELAEKV